MSWIELKLNLPQSKLELISGYLFAHGCEGINVKDDEIVVYFSRHRWSDEVRLALVDYIKEFSPSFSSRDFKLLKVSDQDWNRNWKAFFKPIYVTSRIVIRPPWQDHLKRDGDIVITINPQMAFGTGHHESTKLMIMLMEKWIKDGMHVLDIGTGSGILSILSEKLGADSILAIDNDPVALKNAFENARLNATTNKVKFFLAQPENLHPSEYDLVLANINRNVLIRYAELFPEFIKEKGFLILSGILRTDEKTILDAYTKSGFNLVERKALKDWIALVLELGYKKDANEKNGHI